MHVAILCEYGTVNGGENSILAMIERLSSMSFSILAPASGHLVDRIADAGLQHVPISLEDATGRRLPRDAALAHLRSAVEALAPDALHANSLSMGRLTGALAGSLDLPCTAHLRDILKLNRSTIADLNRNDCLFAVSDATRDFHIAQGLRADHTQTVYNGVDPDRFRPRERTGKLHRELGLPPNTKLAVSIGQITLRKGLDVLFGAALANVAALPDLHYLIVGERYSSKAETVAYERALRRKSNEGALSGRVHWLGYRQDVARLLNESDLLIHTARQEPLGRVLLEAGASHTPIVATNVGGTPEIIEDGVSGLLVPPGDVQRTSAAVRWLLADDVRRFLLAAAARERILDRFNVRTRAEELAARWRAAIQQHRSSSGTRLCPKTCMRQIRS